MVSTEMPGFWIFAWLIFRAAAFPAALALAFASTLGAMAVPRFRWVHVSCGWFFPPFGFNERVGNLTNHLKKRWENDLNQTFIIMFHVKLQGYRYNMITLCCLLLSWYLLCRWFFVRRMNSSEEFPQIVCKTCCIQVAILAILFSGLLLPCDGGDSVMASPNLIALFSEYWWVTLQTAKPNRIPSMDPRPHLTSRYSLGKSKGWKKCSDRLVPFNIKVECISNRFRMYLCSLVSQKSQLKAPHHFRFFKSNTFNKWWGK